MFRNASIVRSILALVVFVVSANAVTLEELRTDSRLTPSRFARHFSDFKYQFRSEVQTPEVFLATRTGDCDDYATLAAMILREKGYTPRLITVRTPEVVHVVCYVEETGSYLDFNNRNYFFKTVSSDPSLTAIASKVAKSFDSDWTSTTEFTFDFGVKRLVKTVTKGGKRERKAVQELAANDSP